MQVEVRVENVALITAGRRLAQAAQYPGAYEVRGSRVADAFLGVFGCTDHCAAKSASAWRYPDDQSIGAVLPNTFDWLAR